MCRNKDAFMMMLDQAKVQIVLLVDFYYSERRGSIVRLQCDT